MGRNTSPGRTTRDRAARSLNRARGGGNLRQARRDVNAAAGRLRNVAGNRRGRVQQLTRNARRRG